ncbi:unnamed protein product [Clonostachys rosea f. rosea IK726]|jgi:hypothetical protein|uniref:Uncharacterized protein n=2 Tax=Bionectria ochroleuca TaxID=29856 RepID=A0A8H7NLW9_BIOOC|nr:unnamed protein product [Clonostachys rosea f. rosea IK726]
MLVEVVEFKEALDNKDIEAITEECWHYAMDTLKCKDIKNYLSDQKEQRLKDIARDVFDALRINRKENPQAFNALINKIKATHIRLPEVRCNQGLFDEDPGLGGFGV